MYSFGYLGFLCSWGLVSSNKDEMVFWIVCDVISNM